GFDILGCTFRPRTARYRVGEIFVNFLPAMSNDDLKEMSREPRIWRINRRRTRRWRTWARMVNTTVHGWINYDGCFYRTGWDPLLRKTPDNDRNRAKPATVSGSQCSPGCERSCCRKPKVQRR